MAEEENKINEENCNKLFTQRFRTEARQNLFTENVWLGKEPTKINEEKILYLHDILDTKPIEQLHPHSSIII